MVETPKTPTKPDIAGRMPAARPARTMPGGSAALPEGSLPKPFLGPQGDEQRDPPANAPSPVPPSPVVERQVPPPPVGPKRR